MKLILSRWAETSVGVMVKVHAEGQAQQLGVLTLRRDDWQAIQRGEFKIAVSEPTGPAARP